MSRALFAFFTGLLIFALSIALLFSAVTAFAQESEVVIEKDGQYYQYRLERSWATKTEMDTLRASRQAEKTFLESLPAWTPQQVGYLMRLFNQGPLDGMTIAETIAKRLAEISREIGAMDIPVAREADPIE